MMGISKQVATLVVLVTACGFPRPQDVPSDDHPGSADAGGADVASPVDSSGFDDGSPDAESARQRVLYSSPTQVASLTVYQLFSSRLDGTERKQLTNEPGVDDGQGSPTGVFRGAVSADGKYFLFGTSRTTSFNLVVENIDGTGRRVLINNCAGGDPAVSADGQRVAYSFDSNIYVASFARGDSDPVMQITSGTGHSYYDPSWGGNSKIAFTNGSDIMLVNADGTGLTNLTNNASRNSSLSFSRDGTKIAFTSRRLGQDQVWIMNADGSASHQVTTDPSGVYDGVAFDLSGEHILYMDGNFIINMIKTDGSARTPIGLSSPPPYSIYPE